MRKKKDQESEKRRKTKTKKVKNWKCLTNNLYTLSQWCCCFDSNLMWMIQLLFLSKCRIDETVRKVKLRKCDSLNFMVILCGAHWMMPQLTLIKSSTIRFKWQSHNDNTLCIKLIFGQKFCDFESKSKRNSIKLLN